jgi:hypothetical protein
MDARGRRLEGLEGAASPLQQQSPRRCRLRALAHPLEKRQTQGFLELSDMEADGGLAQAKDLGGPREALEPGDLVEGAEVRGIERHNDQNFS